MKNVKTILLNPKITRGELSKVYKEIKILNLGIPWLDVLRKTTRANVVVKWEKFQKAKQMDDMNNMKKKINKITNKIKKQQKEIKQPKKKHSNKLKELLDHIKHLKPIAGSYYVVSVFFTDGTNLHSTITPNNKEQIQKDLLESTIDKSTLDGHGFSDASMIYIKGETIKSFDVKDSRELEKTQKSLFTKLPTK